jgi:hypothetical protein
MSFLFSNFPPIRTEFSSYTDKFKDLLLASDQIKIATGYISSDSVVDLKSIIEANKGPKMDLCIGMHYFEGLTPIQSSALESLDKSLSDNNLGKIYMVTTFPFHGKVVSFSKNSSVTASILGSSNLSNIIDGQRQYEVDYLFENGSEPKRLQTFIEQLISVSSKPLNDLQIKVVQPNNSLLNEQLGVIKFAKNEQQEIIRNLSANTFTIPLKGDEAPKSSLNVFFGEGRRNQQGFVIPRPWYEVELIVSKNITQQKGYPSVLNNNSSFTVITDDGWSFKCKVSGDYSKNLRSEDDLKILGKWIKGRLENAGVLKPGEMVTDSILNRYGRSDIKLTQIKDSNNWYLDFGVKHE